MREALVTQDMPQNSWPTVAMMITNFALALESALSMIEIDVPPAPLTAFVFVAANVSASITSQPMTPDPKTKLNDWWWSGRSARSAMMIATPITCHQTDTLLSSATSCDE